MPRRPCCLTQFSERFISMSGRTLSRYTPGLAAVGLLEKPMTGTPLERATAPTAVTASALSGPRISLAPPAKAALAARSEEHTSELQSLMRISYAVFCLKKKKQQTKPHIQYH